MIGNTDVRTIARGGRVQSGERFGAMRARIRSWQALR